MYLAGDANILYIQLMGHAVSVIAKHQVMSIGANKWQWRTGETFRSDVKHGETCDVKTVGTPGLGEFYNMSSGTAGS